MADEHGPTMHHQPDKADGPKLKGKKTTWYIVGGLGLVAVLVFLFVRKSNSNANASQSSPGTTGGLDPATESALQSALSAQASGAFSGGGAVQGPAGPVGPAGPAGPAGKTGASGTSTSVTSSGGKVPGPKPHSKDVPRPPAKAHKTFYTVKSGDNLSGIASHFGLSNWQSLYNANRNVVGNNPNMIYPGQRLLIP